MAKKLVVASLPLLLSFAPVPQDPEICVHAHADPAWAVGPPGISCGHSGCGTGVCPELGNTYVQAAIGGSCEPGTKECTLFGRQVTLNLIIFTCNMVNTECLVQGEFKCKWTQQGIQPFTVTDCK
jgi:hypothetical protein